MPSKIQAGPSQILLTDGRISAGGEPFGIFPGNLIHMKYLNIHRLGQDQTKRRFAAATTAKNHNAFGFFDFINHGFGSSPKY